MAKYCGVQTCNRPGTVELVVNETKHGVEIRGTTYLCVSHYDQAHPGTNPAWPTGGQHSFPACATSPRGDVWDWRPRVGETPEQRTARVEQDEAAAAYRATREYKQARAEVASQTFIVPEFPCDIWDAGKKDHEVVVSFVEADVFQEDILDALAFHGNYARRITVLEAAE